MSEITNAVSTVPAPVTILYHLKVPANDVHSAVMALAGKENGVVVSDDPPPNDPGVILH